jgi:uncharacterized Zn-binding protein involved in type VI secretion
MPSQPAARVGDFTTHGGFLTGPGCPTVWIGGKPAALVGDSQVCPLVDGVKPHGGGVITLGSLTVFIGGRPAARVGDMTLCVGPPGTIAPPGCPSVMIG